MKENYGEPWQPNPNWNGLHVLDNEGRQVADCDRKDVPDHLIKGRARRIAACVNACQGISTATLEALGAMEDRQTAKTLLSGVQMIDASSMRVMLPNELLITIIRVLNVHGLKAHCDDDTNWTGTEEQRIALNELHQALCDYLPPLPEQTMPQQAAPVGESQVTF